MARELTLKQEKFCQKYVETGNKSEAYRYAYDSENMKPDTINRKAHEIGKQDNIRTRIEQIKAELMEQLNINQYTVAKSFVEIRDKCTQVEPVTDSMGEKTGEYKFDATNAIKANVELGKMIGAYEKDNSQKQIIIGSRQSEDDL